MKIQNSKYNYSHGQKIRKADVNEINEQLLERGDIFQEYWENKNYGDFDNDISNYNQVISKMGQSHIETLKDTSNEDGALGDPQKVWISGLVSKVGTKKKIEEPGVDEDAEFKESRPVQNQVITSYVRTNERNQLDDLKQLLQNSSKYHQAKKSIRNGKYTDHKFPGNEYSIYGFGERRDYSLSDLRQLPWLRPEVFFKDQKITVYDQIDPNDIFQGGLGDCYFLAAIAAIAEYPQRLERIFLVNRHNREGVYVVAMCINGVWQDVVMDDLFPCSRYSKEPAFNRSKSGELWVMLLEKAWAKIHGGYMNIAAGLTREALRDLTGASAKTFFTSQNREQLWSQILKADRQKFIMTAGSDDLSNGSDSYVEKVGICGSHAYSLLEAYELEYKHGRYYLLDEYADKRGKTVERILKLRNPWGQGEWKGDWSDKSSLWNDELRSKLKVYDQEDGVFYMNYNDFCKYYSDCQICYYHDGFKYSAAQLSNDKYKTIYIKFQLFQRGRYYLSLNQKNRRFFPKKKRYKYSDC